LNDHLIFFAQPPVRDILHLLTPLGHILAFDLPPYLGQLRQAAFQAFSYLHQVPAQA
jgi:hypothetical protein